MGETVKTGDQEVLEQAYDRVRGAYGGAIGRHRREVPTPALLLDLRAARRNIERMAEHMRAVSADLRPHVKVHKSPELARMQVDAGAIGVSCATVWEAIVMVRSGIDHVLVVNQVAGQEKLAAMAELAQGADVMLCVDNAANAAEIAAAARAANSTLGILIEVDTGMDRAGVDTTEQAVELARQVAALE